MKKLLENCKTLQDCETILSGLLNKVKYIGQVDLSLNDLAVLDNLILSYIDIVGLESAAYFMQKHIPVSTAFYLVYKGVWGYEGGNYWASLSDALSLNDPTSQAEWGSWFLDFLEKNNLIQFDTEGTYRYVSPILLHGGIPQNSVEEFIEKVVIPLVNRGFKEEEEVKDFLFGFRKREQEKRVLQLRIDELYTKMQHAENNAHYWYKFIEYRKLAKELSEIIGDFAHICPWPKNLSEIYTANRRKIILLEEEIRILEEEYNVNLEILSNYTQVESQ
ncbi:MAG TPA: hypothetical protein GX527_10710, partial [Clostridiaceae bacterium]|nr:hypothetical protein [Clostridiaceae bacterium]